MCRIFELNTNISKHPDNAMLAHLLVCASVMLSYFYLEGDLFESKEGKSIVNV